MSLIPIHWKNHQLDVLDQRSIPKEKKTFPIQSLSDGIFAIREMVVRGAPAIAITGMYSMAVESLAWKDKPSFEAFSLLLRELLESRPTAVNLSRAIAGLGQRISSSVWSQSSLVEIQNQIVDYAQGLWQQDIEGNQKIGQNALQLFSGKKKLNIITHCNTGALATAGHGTALGIIRSLHQSGVSVHVYADETRPFLQGSRLTAFEMMEEGIDCTIICDNMSAWLMANQNIDAVIVGCDRIASNGDFANKIGTYALAILAKEHSVPFFVAGTRDSFDLSLGSGKDIPIEIRDPREVLEYHFLSDANGNPWLPQGSTSPVGAKAWNPGFDVTPARYVEAIVTEMGCVSPVTKEGIERLLTSSLSKLS